MSDACEHKSYLLDQVTEIKVVEESESELIVLLGQEPGLRARISQQDLFDGLNLGTIVEITPEPEPEEADDLASFIVKQVRTLLTDYDHVQHAELDIDSTTNPEAGDSDTTSWKKKRDTFTEVTGILKEKYGDPVYAGVGQRDKSYKGPSNPGFGRIYECDRIAWWKEQQKFFCVRISTVDGGNNPFLVLEVYNPGGKIHS